MMPPTLNCGSSGEPEMGRLMSISPLRFCSSDTASLTGSLVALGAIDLVAERQLVEEDAVVGGSWVVVDLVLEEQRQLAALDRIAWRSSTI